MNLFIDTLSSLATLILFDEHKKIKDLYSWKIQGKESITLIPKIDEFLKKNMISYQELNNIVVVNGPGSFTGTRITVLAINTINYVIKKNIIPISYFDLFDTYPIIKSSSRRDCFIQFSANEDIKILSNTKIIEILQQKCISTLFGSIYEEMFEGLKIVDKIDYRNILKNMDITKRKKYKKVNPLYIKKPNIS